MCKRIVRSTNELIENYQTTEYPRLLVVVETNDGKPSMLMLRDLQHVIHLYDFTNWALVLRLPTFQHLFANTITITITYKLASHLPFFICPH